MHNKRNISDGVPPVLSSGNLPPSLLKAEKPLAQSTLFQFEKLGAHIQIAVSLDHRFGTDAFLLSHYADVRRKDKAVDLGTGCGIVALLWFRPDRATGTDNGPKLAYAIDIQPQAIRQLEASVEVNGLQDRLFPLCADLKELQQLPTGSFDLVTCNPPYKAAATGILNQCDSQTIARHEVLCNMQDICKQAARLLKIGGRLCVCQRPERLADVLDAMKTNGIEPKRLRFVQKRGDTAPWLFLAEGKKGAKPYMKVEAPLLVQDESGGPSAQLQEIYGFPPAGTESKGG